MSQQSSGVLCFRTSAAVKTCHLLPVRLHFSLNSMLWTDLGSLGEFADLGDVGSCVASLEVSPGSGSEEGGEVGSDSSDGGRGMACLVALPEGPAPLLAGCGPARGVFMLRAGRASRATGRHEYYERHPGAKVGVPWRVR